MNRALSLKILAVEVSVGNSLAVCSSSFQSLICPKTNSSGRARRDMAGHMTEGEEHVRKREEGRGEIVNGGRLGNSLSSILKCAGLCSGLGTSHGVTG